MGGRGSSSGMSGGSRISSFKGARVRIESDINGLNKALVNKTLNGVRDTLNEFGIPLNTLNGVGVTDSKKAMARACLKNKSYTKHKSYYCLLILKISKINIIYIIIDIF